MFPGHCLTIKDNGKHGKIMLLISEFVTHLQLNKSYVDICKSTLIPPVGVFEFSSMCRVLSDQVRKSIVSITVIVFLFSVTTQLDLILIYQLGEGEISYLLRHNPKCRAS